MTPPDYREQARAALATIDERAAFRWNEKDVEILASWASRIAEEERRRAYADAEDVLQRYLQKQDHSKQTVYDATDRMITEMRLRARALTGEEGER